MAEWSVAGSGSEEDGEAATSYLDFGGIKIPPHRLLQLMQTVHTRKTVQLDSLSDVSTKRKKKKKKKKSAPRLSGEGNKIVEDASETASEIRSTTCTSTTESRDMRRRKYDALFDDPELDDNITLSSSKPSTRTKTKKAPPLTHKKGQQLARLDKITADKLKRKQRWHLFNETQSELSKSNNARLHPSLEVSIGASPPLLQSRMPQQGEGASQGRLPQQGEEEEEGMEVDGENGDLPQVMFDDEDSTDKGDSESDSDMKFSLLPQINKVEELLDFDVS